MVANNAKAFLGRHWIAIFFAVIVGALAVAPQLFAIRAIGAEYRGIHLLTLDDNSYYVARMREILDGHKWASAPFIYEYKSAPPFLYPLGEYVYMWPVFFGVPFVAALIFAKFFFPAVLFLFVYALICALTEGVDARARKFAGVAGGLLATTGYGLVDYNGLLAVFSGQAQFFAWSLWARPVNPVTGAIMLFVFLLLMLRITRGAGKGAVVAGGAVFALMFGYFFTWGMALSVAGVFAIMMVALRDYALIKRLASVLLIGFLFAAPYWYNMRAVAEMPEIERVYAQNGLLLTHAPIANKVLFLALLIFVPCFFVAYQKSKRDNVSFDRRWWFCLALILGGLWALNQQVVTGKTIWPYHFVQYTTPLAVVAVMFALAFAFRPQFPRLWVGGMLGISVLVLFYGGMAVRTYAVQVPEFRAIQKYDGILSWLRANAERDCVVLSAEGAIEEKLARLVPAFTQCNVYANSWMQASYNTDARARYNMLALMRVNGVTAEQARTFLNDNRVWIKGYLRRDWRDFLAFDEAWLAGMVRGLELEYADFMKIDFVEALKRYRVDYITSIGALQEPVLRALHNPPLIGEFNGTYLYRLAL